MKDQIEGARGDAAGLEQLYRQALATRTEPAFTETIRQCVEDHPDDILFTAWVCRLDAQDGAADVEELAESISRESQIRHWRAAVGTSIVLGILYAIFAGNRPPVPIPGESHPLNWLGWAPLTALATLIFLAITDRTSGRGRRYEVPAAGVLVIAAYVALNAWSRTDPVAMLLSLHLPFVAWAAVGASLSLRHSEPARQCYAFFMKSMEAILTGGIFFGAGMIFLGLTYGIFDVLGIKLPQDGLRVVSTWGIGVIPILAIASVYDPTVAPIAQNWTTGLTHVIRILTRILLPLALGVLAVYVFWFVPKYFWRPFQEREVLFVYNATILAILVLLTATATSPDERSQRLNTILRTAVLVLAGITWFLNLYALTALIARTLDFGLTPNRYTGLGWNIVTLLMLASIVIRLVQVRPDEWTGAVRESIARTSILAVVWGLWVLLSIPLAFS